MKHLLAYFFLCAFSVQSYAQPDKIASALFTTPVIQSETTTLLFNDAVRDVYSTPVIGEDDDFYKFWKKYIKTGYMLEGKRESGLYVCGPVKSPSLSEDTVTVYYKIEKEGDFTRITCFGRKGDQYFPQDQLPESNKLKVMIERGILQYYTQLYDEKISGQQKFYDRQAKDVERVKKAGERLAKDKISNEKSLDKFKGQLSSANAKYKDVQNEKKSQEAELEQEKREAEQIKKEIKTQEDLLKEKEVEYNEKFFAASADDKKAEKSRKDLESRREKMAKQQSKLEKKNEKITKVENNVLRTDRKLNETQTSIEKLEAEINRSRNTIDDLAKKISDNESSYKEEVLQMESAKADLERLKMSKGGMVTLH